MGWLGRSRTIRGGASRSASGGEKGRPRPVQDAGESPAARLLGPADGQWQRQQQRVPALHRDGGDNDRLPLRAGARARAQRDERERARARLRRAGPERVHAALVAPAHLDGALRCDDSRGHQRQPHSHLDRARAQAHAHRHQLLPRQSQHRRRHGVHPERHIQLHVHAQQPLALRQSLLQDQPVHLRNHDLRERVHAHGHIDRQIHGDRESPEAADGQAHDPLHHPGDLGCWRPALAANAALLHDLHPELHQWRGKGNLLSELARSGPRGTELQRVFVQRLLHDPDVLPTHRLDDLHVRAHRPRAVGLAEHRRGDPTTAGQHQEQAPGSENDDSRRDDFRHLLAALSRLLHRDLLPAGGEERALHPGSLPAHLLAGHVEQHVQSDHLLLDEFQIPARLHRVLLLVPVGPPEPRACPLALRGGHVALQLRRQPRGALQDRPKRYGASAAAPSDDDGRDDDEPGGLAARQLRGQPRWRRRRRRRRRPRERELPAAVRPSAPSSGPAPRAPLQLQAAAALHRQVPEARLPARARLLTAARAARRRGRGLGQAAAAPPAGPPQHLALVASARTYRSPIYTNVAFGIIVGYYRYCATRAREGEAHIRLAARRGLTRDAVELRGPALRVKRKRSRT